MNILDLNFEQEFIDTFTSGAGSVEDCHCGKEHVAIDSDLFTPEEEYVETIKDFTEREAAGDDIMLHYNCDYIETISVNGLHFIEGCECEGWKPYMNFMINERRNIRSFLIKMAEEMRRAYDQEKILEILKDPMIDVLDK